MLVNGKHYRTVWMEGESVFLIDQNALPFTFRIHESKTYHETCHAIKSMLVRGAPAIGTAAGFAMAQAFLQNAGIEQAKKDIEATRPTAYNLFHATARVYNSLAPVLEAQRMADEDIAAFKKIGEYGSSLIKDGFRIETHCNAGWLACVDYGTALSPIYVAKQHGKKISVLVDETRPRGQGGRLTAWELHHEGIEHRIIADNAGAYFMSLGEVDMVIVGADRISGNGDVANKIGTLEKAICAKEYGIPFYVAAPTSTIDVKCAAGRNIPIEERDENEVLYQSGMTELGLHERILVCSPESHARNPAFDVTPAKYITGIITEKGIFGADKIKFLF